MANAVYPLWKEQILQGTASALLNGSGTTGVYTSLLNTTSYVYSAAHQFYTSFTASPDAVVGTDQEIGATKTYTTGTFDGADLTYTSVTGAVVGALGLYVKNAGASSTWRLFLYLDTSVTGLPVTPNGGNITVTWNASGIVTISDGDLKEAIRKIGKIGPANVYQFRYRGKKQVHTGFIAQEVEKFAPHAVRTLAGRKVVDYSKALAAAERLAA